MKATLYKALSNEKTPVELHEGQTVQEALPDLNLEDAIIIVNGRIESPSYTLKEHDVVMVRLTPGATGLVVTAIIAGVIAVGAAITGGVFAYKAKKEAQKAQEELEKVKKLTNKSDIDNRPFLRGASNTLATGNSQPYIIGRHLFTPYLLCSPFYQITGTDGVNEHTYIVLECGFNKQIIQKLAIDDIIIKSFSQSGPQEGAYDLDTGIFAEDGRVEIAQDGELLSDMPMLNYKVASNSCNDEIPRDTDVSAGKEEYLTYTLNPYAKDVDVGISFPYGLYAYDSDNKKIETKVTITPQYSLDGGNTWNSFTFNNNGANTNVFNRKTSDEELRFVAHKDFTAQDYNSLRANGENVIYIRVRSNGNKDSAIQNTCYCLFYQSLCFDPEKSMSGTAYTSLEPCKVVEDRERAFCTIIGLRLKASKINEDKLRKINVITQGIARTWNGVAWSAEKTATRNPAAWALEIETSPSHPASRRDDSELDLESFGEFYEYCEAKGYKFDWVITQSIKKDDVLNYIMDAAGACIYYDIYGRRAIAIDRPQENALAVYNPQNIISIQNKKTFGRRTDGLRIKYVNSRDDLYQEDTYLVMREENGAPLTLDENSIIKDLTVTGITEHSHIVKYARRLMAIEALRPKTTVIEVGNEGIFYTPYSKVMIQDDSLKIGIGKGFVIRECVWNGGLLRKIRFDGKLTFSADKAYGIIVNCYTATGVSPMAVKVRGEGTTDELIVLSQILAGQETIPEEGNIFSFGELDTDGEFSRITTHYLISNIRRGDNRFTLELVDYNEAIYDSGSIPDYRSNITPKSTGHEKNIPADTVTHDELAETKGLIDDIIKGTSDIANEPEDIFGLTVIANETGLSASWNTAGGGLSNSIKCFEVELSRDGGHTWGEAYSPTSNRWEYVFDRDKDGYPERDDLALWRVRCRAQNIYGLYSKNWSDHAAINTSAYRGWMPEAPKVIKSLAGEDSVTFEWEDPSVCYGANTYSVRIESRDNVHEANTSGLTLSFKFDRDKDGYPEKEDLALWRVTVTAINTSGNSATGEAARIDASVYRGWRPDVPSITTRSSGRAVTINPFNADLRYGKIRYEILINNLDRDDDRWYQPTPTANYLENEGNYCDITRQDMPLEADSPYTQSMPLKGQQAEAYKLYSWRDGEEYDGGSTKLLVYRDDDPSEGKQAEERDVVIDGIAHSAMRWYDDVNKTWYASFKVSMPNPVDTPYNFKVRAINTVAGKESAWSQPVTVHALATSAYDIVKGGITENALAPDAVTTDKIAAGTITANKILVEALAAISANLGNITDGSLVGNANNYWYLSDDYEDGVLMHRAGDFRVGGADGSDYIKCTTENGISYSILIHASKFDITAVGTVIRGAFFVCPEDASIDEEGNPDKYFAKISDGGIEIYAQEDTEAPQDDDFCLMESGDSEKKEQPVKKRKLSALWNWIKGKITLIFYPKGSIYMSTESTDPSTFIGGTWERITDRFLLAAGSSYTAGSTGGAASKTLSVANLPSHTHTFTGSSVTTDSNSHSHSITIVGGTAGTSAKYGTHRYNSQGWSSTLSSDSKSHSHTVTAKGSISSTGSGEAISIMPPYLAVYIWKRTG